MPNTPAKLPDPNIARATGTIATFAFIGVALVMLAENEHIAPVVHATLIAAILLAVLYDAPIIADILGKVRPKE